MCVCVRVCVCVCVCVWVNLTDFWSGVPIEMRLQISSEVKHIIKEATGFDVELKGSCIMPDVSQTMNGLSFAITAQFYTLCF